jgi:hypothetical protein
VEKRSGLHPISSLSASSSTSWLPDVIHLHDGVPEPFNTLITGMLEGFLTATEARPKAKAAAERAVQLDFIITVTYSYARNIPRLSKAGMPSRSEGWGGLFKDESTD